MKINFPVPLLLGMVAALFATTQTMAAPPADSMLVPAEQSAAGATQAEWSRGWWQWVNSFAPGHRPFDDPTGERCGENQQGDVWFLAGTPGRDPVNRLCTVPAGRYLFFPLVTYVYESPGAGGVKRNCMSLMQAASQTIDAARGVHLIVDGVAVDASNLHRVNTHGCFDLGTKLTPPMSLSPSAADGYYAMLKPLSPGKHRITFGGELPQLHEQTTYLVDVR